MTHKLPTTATTLFLVFALLFSACKSKEKKAEESLTEFLVAIEKNDFKKAKEKAAPETKDVIVLVEKDKAQFKKEDPTPVTFTIVEKDVKDDKANFKVKFVVGEKELIEVINVVLVNDVWLVLMPPTQITILRFVVFRNQYHIYLNSHEYYIKSTKKKSKKKSKKKHH